MIRLQTIIVGFGVFLTCVSPTVAEGPERRVTLVMPYRADDLPPARRQILELIRSADTSSTVEFAAAHYFRLGSTIGARRLALIGPNFAEHFLGVIEREVPGALIAASELRYTVADTSIIKSLGGENAAVMHLAHVYAIMKSDAAGGNHTNWQSNIVFARSPIDHRLWAIHWSANRTGDWTIGAVVVPHAALDWAAGTRVFHAVRNQQPLLANGSQSRTPAK